MTRRVANDVGRRPVTIFNWLALYPYKSEHQAMEDRLRSVIPLQPNKVERKEKSDNNGGDKISKKKSSAKERARQTLFKTLSQNNYKLQAMIDRKANILISVNAIILSILLGTSFMQSTFVMSSNVHIIILLASSTLSIIGALIAVKPFLIGSSDKSWQGTNLLSFESSRKMDLHHYKAMVKKTIKKEKRIYDAMIEDIYFISRNVNRKHGFLNASAIIFAIGLMVSSIIMIAAVS